MTLKKIEAQQRKIEKTLQKQVVHPDNELAQTMRLKYRELEQLKQAI